VCVWCVCRLRKQLEELMSDKKDLSLEYVALRQNFTCVCVCILAVCVCACCCVCVCFFSALCVCDCTRVCDRNLNQDLASQKTKNEEIGVQLLNLVNAKQVRVSVCVCSVSVRVCGVFVWCVCVCVCVYALVCVCVVSGGSELRSKTGDCGFGREE